MRIGTIPSASAAPVHSHAPWKHRRFPRPPDDLSPADPAAPVTVPNAFAVPSDHADAAPACLTIAGNDPSGGAGLAADLKTFAAMGVYGMGVLTVATDCVTRTGVEEVHALPAPFVRRQLDRVTADLAPAAVKTGMLFQEAIIRTVAEAAHTHGFSQGESRRDGKMPFVIDPVMTTQQGERLLSDGAEAALREELLPLARVATPSLPEAERLAGRDVRTKKAMRQAAEAILAMGPEAVIVTGGHLAEGPAADLLFDADGRTWLEAERVPRATRGAGDTFSAALAAGLAQGLALRAAAERAKAFVTGALRHAPERGGGSRPLWHEWFGAVPFDPPGNEAPAETPPSRAKNWA